MEAIDPESQQIRDVYAQYGLAMYYAQCVERQLAIVAPMLHGMNIWTTTRDQLEKLLDELFKKTLGTVIKTLETSVGLPSGFEDRLRNALRLRNFLAHEFFWERAGTFTHEQGRHQMLTELREAAVFLAELDEEMSVLARNWTRDQGVTDEVIRAQMNKLTAHGARPNERCS